jgi:methionyl-tRNA formyltransferase
VADVVFLGTPEAAVATLRGLVADGHRVVLVVTRPDRRRGRGGATSPSPVKVAALELGLPVTHRLADVLAHRADVGVVVAYGRLVTPEVLAHLPMINVHFSLLPRWRGAAPVERAVLAGDTVTGVCVMGLEAELDTGPLYACEETAVRPDESVDELRARLGDLGTSLVLRVLGPHGELPRPVAQQGDPTYAEKIRAEELEIDWERPADELARLVRLGRAWTTFRGRRLRIVRARPTPGGAARVGEPAGTLVAGGVVTGQGLLEPTEVVPEGGRPMPFAAWRNGARPTTGERFEHQGGRAPTSGSS